MYGIGDAYKSDASAGDNINRRLAAGAAEGAGARYAVATPGYIVMHSFRVVYHQGSFVLAKPAESRADAIQRALCLSGKEDIWHVHIEDAHGRPVLCNHELAARRDAT